MIRQLLTGLLCFYLIPSEVKAAPKDWLRVIRYAEGTSHYANPYGVTFSGRQFNNNLPHPGTSYCSSGGYCSNAHGAYQFLYSTWVGINGGRNLPMTKTNQDLAAIKLMWGRGVSPHEPFTKANVNRLAPEWASLPTYGGYSYYGQPVKNFYTLLSIFNK